MLCKTAFTSRWPSGSMLRSSPPTKSSPLSPGGSTRGSGGSPLRMPGGILADAQVRIQVHRQTKADHGGRILKREPAIAQRGRVQIHGLGVTAVVDLQHAPFGFADNGSFAVPLQR